MAQNWTKIYYNPASPGSFGGIKNLQRYSGGKTAEIKQWLLSQPTYTEHKVYKKKFKRNEIYVTTIYEQYQLDLIDLSSIAKYNNNFKFLLVIIDCFSRYCWVVPIKNKKGPTVTKAFEKILRKGKQPLKIQTDDGNEFLNKTFRQLLKKYNIKHFTTKSDTKAAMVERLNRTLKERMFRYFTYKNTYKYINVLPKIVSAYNNSYHSSIKRAPITVKESNVLSVWKTLYGKLNKTNIKFKFNVNDTVRISKLKLRHDKGYLPNWSTEIFVVKKRLARYPPVYRIQDMAGESIEGVFYENELQKIITKEGDIYKIEKVLKKKGGKLLVKWLNYPEKFNSWVSVAKVLTYI